jgi:transitional endoplasmic reticulum ATPase
MNPTCDQSVSALSAASASSVRAKITPIASFVRSKNIVKLWTVRMLVRLGAEDHFTGHTVRYHRGRPLGDLRSLGLRPVDMDSSEAARDQLRDRLALTLKVMEARADRYTWSHIVNANLRLLDDIFSLSRAEKAIFVLAAALRSDDDLVIIAGCCKSQVDVTDQLHRILGLPLEQIRHAVSPQGTLRRAGLITVSSGQDPTHNLELQRGRFRSLVTTRLKSVDQLFSEVFYRAPLPLLTPTDYAHLTPDIGFVSKMMLEAATKARRGVNVLLYGSPGTGKTELTRVVAQQTALPIYEVSFVNDNGQPLDARGRLSSASTAQYLLKGRKALLVFDEVDAIFNDGSAFFGKPTTAEQSKAWVNELLERSQVPTFWVANSVHNMDPAFVRRFDVVIEMQAPPLPQRRAILSQLCGEMLDDGQIGRIARVETITPAVVERAANVVRRMSLADSAQACALETLLNGTLTAQGHQTIDQANRASHSVGYDPDLCNANVDLRALAAGIAQSSTGRICLYGPPGTGKTAFGYWLADQLGKPLMLKRVSDIQSPMLGVMERNLAHVFEQASRDGAVLQIDEVDSFLRDRREARQSWEVSQVNEFLTRLENYEDIFIASTNLMGGLDPAALRRFDYKVAIGYLLPHQRDALLLTLLNQFCLPTDLSHTALERLHQLDALTPGDFAVLRRQHRITPFTCAHSVIEGLSAEVAGKEPLHPRRIGFV